jgi:hypothetical protein
MATNIKSTALDFENIKNNLKTFFQAQPEFADYNFEASGLSNILDVLAYNTHYNALTANLALNEAFLGTAQLRSSMVSLSETIGYIPDSRTAAVAYVNLSLTYTSVERPLKIELPKGQTFTGSTGDISYSFETREDLTAVDDGTGLYVFKTSGGSSSIPIYEGRSKTKTFHVGQYGDALVYVIPDTNLDLNTVEVKVKASALDSVYDVYTNITKAITLSEVSQLYLLKEAPNGYFELSFGNGTALGKIPTAGNVVIVDYMSCSGPAANGIRSFVGTLNLSLPGTYTTNAVVTVAPSAGGAEKEDIESMRQNAPYMYASQNRMVTASDYAVLVLRQFGQLIKDIAAWGGQDNVVREFGKIFLSIIYHDGITQETITEVQREITRMAEQLSVLSFTVAFGEPQKTYLEAKINFDFNTNLTDIPLGTMQTNVKNASIAYFEENLGKFNKTFRLSNLLTELDDVSPAVLSSSAIILMQQRITPSLGVPNNFTLQFPAAILRPDDDERIITSTTFNFGGRTAYISNKLQTGGLTGTLQILDATLGTVLQDGVGSYNGPSGRIEIVGFTPTSITGDLSYIKISAVPANSNTIDPENNHVLYQDVDASYAVGTVVYTS